ncbi:hypothetical protein L7F22_019641 [Adiantum nelumboides]|nr:hypothetical protein [Adiantum nelumboides]
MSFKSIPIEDFDKTLGSTSTEVSSVALGGKIVAFSDEWFAPASDLLKVGPAPSMKGQFGPKGALFDGWETRRHNPTYDWVIVRLGPAAGASIVGFDVDTANFNGNEAPEVEIFGLHLSPAEEKIAPIISQNDPRWMPLLPRVPCNPSSRHLYALKDSSSQKQELLYTHVKLHMIPDGGIARFRVYGSIHAPPIGLGVNEYATSSNDDGRFNVLDLAHTMNGGQVVFTSDQHFGVGPNVLLPGRGKDMGDGWETKRSRAPGHKDWLIIRLAEPGLLNYAEIDTAHFLGNFPESVELHGLSFDGQVPPTDYDDSKAEWISILPRAKTGPGKQHYFPLTNVEGKTFSHVRVTMHPDGGIKRVRIFGRRSAPLKDHKEPLPLVALPGGSDKDLPDQPKSFANLAGAAGAAMSSWFNNKNLASPSASRIQQDGRQIGFLGVRNLEVGDKKVTSLKAKPLDRESFAEYGDVIASPNALSLPEQPFKSVNQGTAQKYESLSDVVSFHPSEAQAKSNIHIYRCTPPKDSLQNSFGVRVLERHQFTKQAFIPMSQRGYLVIVAKNGKDDLPDLSTLAAFVATGEQGISYGAGTWHHPMIALGKEPTDFAVVVHESVIQPELNCDEVFWDKDVAQITVAN